MSAMLKGAVIFLGAVAAAHGFAPLSAGLWSDSAPKVACRTFTSPPLVMRIAASPTNQASPTNVGNYVTSMGGGSVQKTKRTSENKNEDGNAAADSMFKNFDKYRNKISKESDDAHKMFARFDKFVNSKPKDDF